MLGKVCDHRIKIAQFDYSIWFGSKPWPWILTTSFLKKRVECSNHKYVIILSQLLGLTELKLRLTIIITIFTSYRTLTYSIIYY